MVNSKSKSTKQLLRRKKLLLPVGELPPNGGRGWQLVTGNVLQNCWVRS